MEFAPADVMTLLYSERQLIVVDDDDAVEVAWRLRTDEAARNRQLGFAATATAAAAGGAVAIAAIAARELLKTRNRADSANLPYLIVSTTQAKNLRFPNGHPLKNVVYVGDPGVAGNYYPIASFHRILFEGKVAEALRLLRSLGATEISIEYIEGFDRGAGVDLSVSAPEDADVEVGGRAKATSKRRSGAKSTMQLSPSLAPQIPKDLIWFREERLWQEVANARLESGLRSFTLDVNYTYDYGVNASLKAKIAKVGLELGGDFTECRETIWKLSGSFAEPPPLDATSV